MSLEHDCVNYARYAFERYEAIHHGAFDLPATAGELSKLKAPTRDLQRTSPEQRASIISLTAEHKRPCEITRILGISYNTVRNVIRKDAKEHAQ